MFSMASKMAVSIIYNLLITPIIKCLSSYSKTAHTCNSVFSVLEDTFQLTDLFPFSRALTELAEI